MSRIRVNTEGISELCGRLNAVEHGTNDVLQQISSANRSLHMKTANAGDIRERIRYLEQYVSGQQNKLNRYVRTLNTVNDKFSAADLNIAHQAQEVEYLMDRFIIINALRNYTQETMKIFSGLTELGILVGLFHPCGVENLFLQRLHPFPLGVLKPGNVEQRPFLSIDRYNTKHLPGISAGLAVSGNIIKSGYLEGYLDKFGSQSESGYGSKKDTVYLGKAHAAYKLNFPFGGVKGEYNVNVLQLEKEKKWKFMSWKEGSELELKNGELSESQKKQFTILERKYALNASVISKNKNWDAGSYMLGVSSEEKNELGFLKGEVDLKLGQGDNGGVDAYAKGEAMVGTAAGEVSKTLNLLGLKAKIKVGGYAGAVGVEGKIGIKNGNFVMDGGAASVLGLKAGVEIGLNDGGIAAMNKIEEEIQSFGAQAWDDLQDAGDSLKDFGQDLKEDVQDFGQNLKENVQNLGEELSDIFGS